MTTPQSINKITLNESIDFKVIIRFLLAPKELGLLRDKIYTRGEFIPNLNERQQLEKILSGLFIKTPNHITFSRKQLIFFYNHPELFNNNLKVEYIFGSKRNFGRVFPKGGIGLASLRREIRHTLSQGKMIDIDMANAHFSILNSHSKKQFGFVNSYCENKADNWRMLREHYKSVGNIDLTDEMCKSYFTTVVFYGGDSRYWSEENNVPLMPDYPMLDALREEMERVFVYVRNLYPDLFDELCADSTVRNPKSSLVSLFCQDEERKILEIIYFYLLKKKVIGKKSSVVLIYDGLQIPLVADAELLLKQLEMEIFKKSGFGIRLVVKPFDKCIDRTLLDFEIVEEVEQVEAKEVFQNLTLERQTEIDERLDACDDELNIRGQLERLIENTNDYDMSVFIHSLFKNNFACSDTEKNDCWYAFENHLWREDGAKSLSTLISTFIADVFLNEIDKLNVERASLTAEEEIKINAVKCKGIYQIVNDCKTVKSKSTWIVECKTRFYIPKFIERLDTNKYLLGCKNGVIDFKLKCLRDGKPEDMVSLSTNQIYTPCEENSEYELLDELDTFMNEIMPFENLRDYLYHHLASCLIGSNKNQSLNFYIGNGANGKSLIVALMALVLGGYFSVVPVGLICGKRQTLGAASSEVAQLRGIRYAVIQEPNKDEVINEGIMKGLVGGDPIQARPLFKNSFTFDPQFGLVVVANYLLSLDPDDGGSWRRMKLVEFPSKFLDSSKIKTHTISNENDDGTESTLVVPENPLEFVIDKDKRERFVFLAPILLSVLVKIAFKTDGNVAECQMVTDATNEYRGSLDKVNQYIRERLVFCDESVLLPKRELLCDFNSWYELNYKVKPLPKLLWNKLESMDCVISSSGVNGVMFPIKNIFQVKEKTDKEIFIGEFHKSFIYTKDENDKIPSVSICEWAKLSNLKISTSKGINLLLKEHFGLDTTNKSQYKQVKISGKPIQHWIGLRRRSEEDAVAEVVAEIPVPVQVQSAGGGGSRFTDELEECSDDEC